MKTRLAFSVSNAIAFVTIAVVLLTVRPAAGQDQLWITQFGSEYEMDRAYALAPDGAGGVMIAGYTKGSLSGPNAGVPPTTDAFLARYDEAGTQLWIRQFGTSEYEEVFALAPDGAGGVMVAGRTMGSLGGPQAGNADVFLARYDGDGNQLWLRQFGTSAFEMAWALASDGAGGVFIAGHTDGSLGGSQAGLGDAFLARYDGAGNQLWIRQFGTIEGDLARTLVPDGAGGIYVGGWTSGSLGGPSAGYADAFLARFDGAGNQLWMHQFGTNQGEGVYALAPDGAGGVMVAGTTGGSLAGPNEKAYVLIDAFVARYDGAGNQLWIEQFGTSHIDEATALAPDGVGGVIVAGDTRGNLGGPSARNVDGYLARYDSNGHRLWVRQFGTDRVERTWALVADGTGGVMVAGYTKGSLGGPNLIGDTDAFLARYSIDTCYPDCDHSTGNGVLDLFDFLCWQNDFVIGNSYACDCDMSTGQLVCDMFDFLCFQDAFVAGCP